MPEIGRTSLTGKRLCTMPSWMNMYMIPNRVMPSPAPKQTPPIREGVMKLHDHKRQSKLYTAAEFKQAAECCLDAAEAGCTQPAAAKTMSWLHTPQCDTAVSESTARLLPIQAEGHGRHSIGNSVDVVGLKGANARLMV